MTPDAWQQLKDLFNAALERVPEDRPSFLAEVCEGDNELRIRLERLLASHEEAGPFLVASALVDAGVVAPEEPVLTADKDGRIGQRIGPYEIIREIGHGGMGTVFLAIRADDQYRKQVAIKIINRGMDTDEVLRRFMMERQILANLEHPNIARLLEGGSTTDGLPYFVMEYVEGQPIDEYCDARAFTTTERLELFRQVCAALQYAHQNLVVHRDIKPSNILVTAEGVPKLLDFGIAKLLSPGWSTEMGDPTASMQVLMTPAYASPEQLSGLSITTASDVYSLGVVLYELLSGRHPYRLTSRQPDEVVRHIAQQEPLKPSDAISDLGFQKSESKANVASTAKGSPDAQTNSQLAIRNPKFLRGDLDNIVLKALRKEPERRYPSVQELSEDIRKHLEGLPVTATPDTFGYRAGKFIQRNKAGVAAAAVIVVTLLTGSVITAWQARIARRERDKAERRFNQVRQLSHKVLFDYHDGIERLPGSTPLREKMVKDALEYLDNLAAENTGDTSLQSELATAYFKVGEVQGAPSKSSLGDYGGGLISFKKSLAIREQLLKSEPHNEQFKIDLARSYQMVGHLLQVTDDVPGALENYRKAFAVFGSLTRWDLDAKRDFAALHTRFGNALSASGELPKAIEAFRKSIAITGELISQNPDDREVKRDFGIGHVLLGDALEEARDFNEALAAQRTAFATLAPLVLETNAQSRRDANAALGRIGDVLFKLGKYHEALEIQQKALAVDEEQLRIDPANALARRDVQIDVYKIARNQALLGDVQSALISQRRVIGFCEAAVSANPESSESRGDLAIAYFRYGEMLEQDAQLQAALEGYKKAMAIEEAMSKADPANKAAVSDLSEDYLKVSDVSLKLGRRSEALAGYLKALAIREQLAADGQETPEGRSISARIYESLGAYFMSLAADQRRVADWQETKKWYQKGLDIWKDLQLQGKLATDYANKPNEAREKLAQCEKAITMLTR